MKICKLHYAALEREVQRNPQLWYSLFGTMGYWFVPETECEICEVLEKEAKKDE